MPFNELLIISTESYFSMKLKDLSAVSLLNSLAIGEIVLNFLKSFLFCIFKYLKYLKEIIHQYWHFQSFKFIRSLT